MIFKIATVECVPLEDGRFAAKITHANGLVEHVFVGESREIAYDIVVGGGGGRGGESLPAIGTNGKGTTT